MSEVRLFGVRHHGPGCARALKAALDAWNPDVVLLEGPPEADPLVPLAADPELVPPVALLVHAKDEPARAAFYPLAHFSPEWIALHWAATHKVPLRFFDLPVCHRLDLPDGAGPEAAGMIAAAHAAGFSTVEELWDHEVELRRDPADLFAGIAALVRELRSADAGPMGVRTADREDTWVEARREAFMRQSLRTAQKEGFARIAAVCGAWHVPALEDLGGVGADRDLLRGLPRQPVRATWIPWTWSRLAARAGYGAGVASPGWYAEVFAGPDGLSERWLSRAARLLRDRGVHVAAADVIAAVRMADALAALRDRPRPGLAELRDAAGAVFAGERLAFVRDALEVGARMGTVPEFVPEVPLQQDVHRLQKRLRLKPTEEPRELDLDLRDVIGLERSQLLHRLDVLGVPWGRPREGGEGDQGTFRERWWLSWDPDLELRIIEASVWGNTAADAATARIDVLSAESDALPELVRWLDKAMLADCPVVVPPLLARVAALAAVAPDQGDLIDAIVPLARAARYGDVRRTPTDDLLHAARGLLTRVAVGLPFLARALSDEPAATLADRMATLDRSVGLLDGDAVAVWTAALRTVVDGVAPRIGGRAVRLLLERGELSAEEADRRARVALSPVEEPDRAAAWLEGLVAGSGLLLLELEGLWDALDAWLAALPEDAFLAVLPAVRRAFADFAPAERAAMGRRARGVTVVAAPEPVLDADRAAAVLPVLRLLGAGLGPPS